MRPRRIRELLTHAGVADRYADYDIKATKPPSASSAQAYQELAALRRWGQLGFHAARFCPRRGTEGAALPQQRQGAGAAVYGRFSAARMHE